MSFEKWISGSTISTNRFMIKSTLKIARYCPLVIQGFSIFLGLKLKWWHGKPRICDSFSQQENSYEFSHLEPPRASNFSPQVYFWWLRGTNFTPLEDLYSWCFCWNKFLVWSCQVVSPPSNSNQWRFHMHCSTKNECLLIGLTVTGVLEHPQICYFLPTLDIFLL